MSSRSSCVKEYYSKRLCNSSTGKAFHGTLSLTTVKDAFIDVCNDLKGKETYLCTQFHGVIFGQLYNSCIVIILKDEIIPTIPFPVIEIVHHNELN